MAKVDVKNICVSYQDKNGNEFQALSEFSLTVESSSFAVVIGPSGCGKTTLLRAIAGLVPYHKGSIHVDGIDISDYKPQERNLAYITQEYTLFPHMTIYDNLAFPLRVTKTPYEEIDGRIIEVAKMTRIEMLLSRKPRQLSGGQQQSVALAKAIIKRPSLYLFDEPFSNLDLKLRHQLRRLLLSLQKSLNASFIFVTHDLSDVMQMADNITIINQGKLIQSGSLEDIFYNPANDFVSDFFNSVK